MKKIGLLFITAGILLSACKQEKLNEAESNTLLTKNFYKRLEGSIGGDQVIIQLQKHDSIIFGGYTNQGEEHHLILDSVIGDSLILIDYKLSDREWDDVNAARLHLKWVGNGFNGNWNSKKSQETLPVITKEKYPQGSLKFDIFEYKESLTAFKNKKDSPKSKFYFYAPNSENNWINSEFKKAMDSVGTGDWIDIALKQSKNYLANYVYDAEELIKDYPKMPLAVLNYFNSNQGIIHYNNHGYVVLNKFSDSYSGGAHGYSFSLFHNYDVKNKKKMKLQDVIRIDSNELGKIITKNYRISRNIPENEKLENYLFQNKIMPSKEFYFNDLGLGFLYNPYDIASYADGQIFILIPYKQIKPFLVPDFANRMGLN